MVASRSLFLRFATVVAFLGTTILARPSEAQVLEQDSLILVDLYDQTKGDMWSINDWWKVGTVPSWWGVTGVENGRVTGINLSVNNLDGAFPSSLSGLTALRSLNLAVNKLSGEIPTGLGDVPALVTLFLSDNLLEGGIPTSFGNLTELEDLWLKGNALTGPIPAGLGNLVKLRTLRLERNYGLDGEIPATLGNLLELIELDVQANLLEGAVPATLNNLKKLEIFSASSNRLVDLPDLTGMTALTGANVQVNRLTFEDIEPNVALANGQFFYSGQDSVDTAVDEGALGETILSVEVGGANNQYQWCRTPFRFQLCDPIIGATEPSLTPVVPGYYWCEITNPTAPQLTLFSRVQRVESFSQVVNTTVDGDDTNPADGSCDIDAATPGSQCSFRAAIQTANASGGSPSSPTKIAFDIAVQGTPSIQPTSPLPVVAVPVDINGTTQMPAGRVEVFGGLAGAATDGLVLAGGSSTVRGLVINGFSGNGLVMRTNGDNVVEDVVVGWNVEADVGAGNGVNGIWIDGVSNNRIGGTAADAVVRIAANDAHGVLISGSGASDNHILNTIVGRSPDGSGAGNAQSGVHIRDASGNDVGDGTESGQNTIRGNGEAGVEIVGTSLRNTVRRNGIFGNGGLGIDLAGDGRTANDLGVGLRSTFDTDNGPNDLLNVPVGVTWSKLPADPQFAVISGVLDAGTLEGVVDIYISSEADESGSGEGEVWLASATPTSEGIFQATVNADEIVHPFLSATYSDFAGNTSEFSPVCLDPDGDGNVDSDGDSLCDSWEASGIDYDVDGIVDLALHEAAFGANPSRKDLFVEIDYMDGHVEQPVPRALRFVEQRFNRRDVSLHAMVDEALPHQNVIRFRTRDPGVQDDFNDIKAGNPVIPCDTGPENGHFGTVEDRGKPNCAAILGARRLVFRYAVFAHSFAEAPRSSGVAELPGNDFIVGMGGWSDASVRNAGGSPNLAVARRRNQAATFMHEFGHTLRLRHGGGDDHNCKPNYPSIMSYTLQFRARVSDRVLDYSDRIVRPSLDKAHLNESAGMRGPPNRKIGYYSPPGQLRTSWARSRTIDWNGMNPRNEPDVAVNVNDRGDPGCSGTGNPLVSYDDWASLQYNFRIADDFADGDVRESVPVDDEEMTDEMVDDDAMTFDYDEDGIVNADDNCPPYFNPGQEDADNDGVGDICQQSVSEMMLEMEASSDEVAPGDQIVYSMTVYSRGPDTASVSLTDSFGDAGRFVSVSTSSGSCSSGGNDVNCDLGRLALDDSVTVELVIEATAVGLLTNSARVSTPLFEPDSTDNQTELQTVVAVGIDDEHGRPRKTELHQNYPNPFASSTTIAYALSEASYVRLTLLDLLGREVRVLVSVSNLAGAYEVSFDATGLPRGIYFYRMEAEGFRETRRMVVVR